MITIAIINPTKKLPKYLTNIQRPVGKRMPRPGQDVVLVDANNNSSLDIYAYVADVDVDARIYDVRVVG